jgi:hypothetical protein
VSNDGRVTDERGESVPRLAAITSLKFFQLRLFKNLIMPQNKLELTAILFRKNAHLEKFLLNPVRARFNFLFI